MMWDTMYYLDQNIFPCHIYSNTDLRADAVDELAVRLLARAVHAPQRGRDAPRGGPRGGGGGAGRGGRGGLGQRGAALEQQHEQQVDQPHRVQDATLVALREMGQTSN